VKGITVYRYGSADSQVLQLGAGEEPFKREHASKCDLYQCRP
jgi:ribonucleotide reductase alpha subunit